MGMVRHWMRGSLVVRFVVAVLVLAGPACGTACAGIPWALLFHLLFSHLPPDTVGVPEDHYRVLCQAALEEYKQEPTSLSFVDFLSAASLADAGRYPEAAEALAAARPEPVAAMLHAKLVILGQVGGPEGASQAVAELAQASEQIRNPVIACSTALDAANAALALRTVGPGAIELAMASVTAATARLGTTEVATPERTLLAGALWKGTAVLMVRADASALGEVSFDQAYKRSEDLLSAAQASPVVRQAAFHELGDLTSQVAAADDRWVRRARPGTPAAKARGELYSIATDQWERLEPTMRSPYLAERMGAASVRIGRGGPP